MRLGVLWRVRQGPRNEACMQEVAQDATDKREASMEEGAMVSMFTALWHTIVLLLRYAVKRVMHSHLVPVGAMTNICGLDKSPYGPRYVSFSPRPLYGDMDIFGVEVYGVFYFCPKGITELACLLWYSPEREWRVSDATVIYATVID